MTLRIGAIIVRIARQFLRDRRTLALLIVAPVFVLTLMSLIFNGETVRPDVGVGQIPEPLVAALERSGLSVERLTAEEAESRMKNGKLDAYLSIDDGRPRLTLEGSDPAVSRAVLLAVQNALRPDAPEAAPGTSAVRPDVVYLYGDESMTAFDNFGPVLIGFFAFFFVFLIAGVSFLRERTGGTLERLMASPLRRWEIVVGYMAGFGLFACAQAALIAWYAVRVLDMRMEGSFGQVLAVTLLLAVTALALGIWLSAFANNEFQMVQFIPVVLVPQVFFSGLFSLDAVAGWLRWLHDVMPLSYGADALRDIMIRGKSWADIADDLAALAGFSFAFMLLAGVALRKHRSV